MSTGSAGSHTRLHDMLRKCVALNIPVQATLELTYRCNLNCGHCYIDCKESDELTLDEWRQVLDQLKAAGLLYILFTGGEIMVRRDFLDIATYARRRGLFISLLTNCTLVTPEMALAIAALRPVSIGTSLYGASASTHESITRVPGSFNKTVEGIKLLVQAGLVPRVQTVVMKSLAGELPKIKELAKEIGAISSAQFGLAPSRSGSNYPSQYELSEDEVLESGLGLDFFGVCVEEGPGVCRAGKTQCSVSPSGDVFPCNLFPLKLGNIRESSFETIWRLEPCAELRYLRSMRRSDLHACQVCEVKAYCHRCTAVAFIETGRMDGPSPTACRWAQMRWRLTQDAEVTQCQKKPTLNRKSLQKS